MQIALIVETCSPNLSMVFSKYVGIHAAIVAHLELSEYDSHPNRIQLCISQICYSISAFSVTLKGVCLLHEFFRLEMHIDIMFLRHIHFCTSFIWKVIHISVIFLSRVSCGLK